MSDLVSVSRTNPADPISADERIIELDALRGIALFGVLVANLVLFSISNNISTDTQQGTMFAVEANRIVLFAVLWLIDDKASTLFAILFGAGFWLQISRLKTKGAGAQRVYLRRLLILLAIGLANLFLIWPWDILQQYALVGIILLAIHRLPSRRLLLLGLALSISGKPLIDWFFQANGSRASSDALVYSEEAIQNRQNAYLGTGYQDWVGETAILVWNDYLLSGAALGWAAYVLGRFLFGVYLMQGVWIERSSTRPLLLRRATIALLSIGLLLEAARSAILLGFFDTSQWMGTALQAVGAPVLALGYAGAILLLCCAPLGNTLLRPFAAVGQMALTNYLTQGFFIAFLLYGHSGGLALAGRLSPCLALTCAIPFFVFQAVLSRFWLTQFQRGPVEAFWRWGTYARAFRYP
ncbi:MAG: DUF418 domain-containing protein [Pseudomonadota bacterium]